MRMRLLPHFSQVVNIDLITKVVAIPARWVFKSDRHVYRKYWLWGKPVREHGWSYLEPAHVRVYFPGDYYNFVESLPCKPGEVRRLRDEINEFLKACNN